MSLGKERGEFLDSFIPFQVSLTLNIVVTVHNCTNIRLNKSKIIVRTGIKIRREGE